MTAPSILDMAKTIQLFSSAAYRKAVSMGETGNECAVCGKQTNDTHRVEYQDQGFFPVGPECFKRLAVAGYTVEKVSE